MDRDQFREFVRRLDSDEVADTLGLADERTRTAVLERLDEDRREKAEFPLEFSPESAAGLMHLDYVTTWNGGIETIAQRVQHREDRTGRFPTIFITTATDVLGSFIFLGLAQAVI